MKIISYDGNDFGSDYSAWVLGGDDLALPAVTSQLVERTGNWPRISQIRRPGRKLSVAIFLDGEDKDALRTQLFQWLDPEDETPKELVGQPSDTKPARYVSAICEDLRPWAVGDKVARNWYVATMAVHGDVRWRASTADSVEWTVTGTGDTETVTNGGDDTAYPKFTIEPTAVNSLRSNLAGRWVAVAWKATAAVTDYPMRLGALDTASLINTATTSTLNGGIIAGDTTIALADASSFGTTGMAYITDAVNGDEQFSWTGKSGNDLTGCTRGIGGTSAAAHSNGDTVAVSKMLANGDDLRVWVDGVEDENRWLVDIDSANTYVWVNMDFSARVAMTLDVAFADTDTITSITVNEAITSMPTSGILLIGTEAFVYAGVSTSNNQFTGVTRAAKGTTAASHANTDPVYWVQHDVWLVYNDESASAPATDDDYKPIIEETSTNASWVYQEFGEDDGLRTGKWRQVELSGSNNTFYTANRTGDADPWEEAGVTVVGTGGARWEKYNPCCITNANFTNGEKRATDVAKWSGASIDSKASGGGYANEYVIPVPALDNTWEAWSRNEGISAGRHYVAVTLLILSGCTGDIEFADCTLTLNSTYTPAVSLPGSETTGAYTLAATITNNETGESISLSYTTELNEELEVDTDAKTVLDLRDDSSQMQALTVDDGPRRHWLALEPGDNELEWTEAGATGLTVTVEFEERYYS